MSTEREKDIQKLCNGILDDHSEIDKQNQRNIDIDKMIEEQQNKTLRDRFAMVALNGMLSANRDIPNLDDKHNTAQDAYADAMMQ